MHTFPLQSQVTWHTNSSPNVSTQRPNKMGVTRDVVVTFLLSTLPNLVALCNNLVTGTLTIGCLRPDERSFQRGFPEGAASVQELLHPLHLGP